MSIEDYLSQFGKMKDAFEGENFEAAYRGARDLVRNFPGASRPYVFMSLIVQLMEEPPREIEDPLKVSKEYLELASKVEPKMPEPFYELGYYHHVVEDDVKAAWKYFYQAYEIVAYHLKPTLIGLLKCHIEFNDEENFKSTMKLADAFFPDDFEIGFLKDDWDERHSA